MSRYAQHLVYIVQIVCSSIAAAQPSAAPTCAPPPVITTPLAKPLAASAVAKLAADASIAELVKALGPAARDVGSGLYIVEWDLSDGRVLRLSATGLCAKPMSVVIGAPLKNTLARP
jgi:hypothetical protein